MNVCLRYKLQMEFDRATVMPPAEKKVEKVEKVAVEPVKRNKYFE